MTRSRSQGALSERQLADRCASFSEAKSMPRAGRDWQPDAALRILHIDDEPDIREVVELSLALDPRFTVRSCASAIEALANAAEWQPDLILCDVMMPVLDGPATLARLRDDPRTARIPVVFMTARAQTRELEHFKSLGAAGVISKPFDPMTLAATMREHLRAAGLLTLRGGFMLRLQADAEALAQCQADLADADASSAALEQIKTFAHALAGAAGIFGFAEISTVAAELEKVASAAPDVDGTLAGVGQALDVLLLCIRHVADTGTAQHAAVTR